MNIRAGPNRKFSSVYICKQILYQNTVRFLYCTKQFLFHKNINSYKSIFRPIYSKNAVQGKQFMDSVDTYQRAD